MFKLRKKKNRLVRTMQILIYVLAFIVFYIGMFLGLQVNPDAGTVLWITAIVIVIANTHWVKKTK